MDNNQIQKLIEENSKLKLRILELEKLLDKYTNNYKKDDEPKQKKLSPPTNIYFNDNYSYWI